MFCYANDCMHRRPYSWLIKIKKNMTPSHEIKEQNEVPHSQWQQRQPRLAAGALQPEKKLCKSLI